MLQRALSEILILQLPRLTREEVVAEIDDLRFRLNLLEKRL